MPTSAEILRRFCRARNGAITLALEPAYLDLLKKLSDPHKKLPPVIHVAGTNGKGSTCAFLRAMLEAAGYKVHVYTSPHLVRFHERIRIAGALISEAELTSILEMCERFAEPGKVSDFEVATATAFFAFAKHPADFVILEVGMGGRLDATNVIETSTATVITRLSYDHTKYLGETLADIAREKAGIMRANVPCFIAPQPQAESLQSLQNVATSLGVPLSIGGKDWNVEPLATGGFRFTDNGHVLTLPAPALLGQHQFWNAGLAIAASAALQKPVAPQAITRGLQTVEWPARLQPLTTGVLAGMLPPGWELWLDGGHNDSAAEVLALQLREWRRDGRPLQLIFGMLNTKSPREFLTPLAPYVDVVQTIAIPDEVLSIPGADLAERAQAAGIESAMAADTVHEALARLARRGFRQDIDVPGRVLICGSLYLAGAVLRMNEAIAEPMAALD